jgi:NHL repeat
MPRRLNAAFIRLTIRVCSATRLSRSRLVAIALNGDIFVGDGHAGGGTANGNARIMKFNKDGKFLQTWGKKGMGPGEFDVIHTLAFDSRGRLFVGDRQNNRIQIFDQNGNFIAQWFQFGRPSGLHICTNCKGDEDAKRSRPSIGKSVLGHREQKSAWLCLGPISRSHQGQQQTAALKGGCMAAPERFAD